MTENEYVRQVLAAYRQTPTTAGRIRHEDRLLAAQLYRRGIPFTIVENALVLGAYRRLYRDLDASPLAPVRSLHYFQGLIQEILAMKVCPPGYFQYLRYRVQNFERFKEQFLQDMRSQQT